MLTEYYFINNKVCLFENKFNSKNRIYEMINRNL